MGKLSKTGLISAAAIAAVLGLAFDSFTVIKEGELGVPYRAGKFLTVEGNGIQTLGAGTHFKAPVIDRIQKIAAYEVPVSVTGLKLQAGDGLSMEDLSFEFHYQVNPNAIAPLLRRYSAEESTRVGGVTHLFAEYVRETAIDAADRVVARLPSSRLHNERQEIADLLVGEIGQGLNEYNPLPEPFSGQPAFVVSRVRVHSAVAHELIASQIEKRLKDAVLQMIEPEATGS